VLRLDPHEVPLLLELARTLDRLARLREALTDEEGGLEPTDPAWVRLAGEERQQRVAYGRLVSQLGLPTGVVPDAASDKVVGLSAASRRGLRAARARWGQAGGERRHAP
jgi:hypothetical protein